jgi:WhiB family redox-sensing transcriptional regulator
MPWATSATCKGQSHLFFPAAGERPEHAAAREHFAVEHCDRCPVLVDCRDYARRNREYGVWGGETEDDRAILGFGVALPIGRLAKRISVYGRKPRFNSSGRVT